MLPRFILLAGEICALSISGPCALSVGRGVTPPSSRRSENSSHTPESYLSQKKESRVRSSRRDPVISSALESSTGLRHQHIQPINPNNFRTRFARPVRRSGIRTRVPQIPHLDNPVHIRADPRMENKGLILEVIPVRNNADDSRLRVIDVVLHDGAAGPVCCTQAALT
jgi:hypothetical protein